MKILAFGIVKNIFGNSTINMDIEANVTVDALKYLLEEKYPDLIQLGSYMIAVNNEYATEKDLINESDDVAIIPPVSGG